MCQIQPLDHKAYEALYYRERNEIPPDLRTDESRGTDELVVIDTDESLELAAS